MPSSNGNSQLYELDLSGAIAKTIRELQRLAARQGRGDEFLGSFRKIVHQLRRSLLKLGEPLYRLAALKLQVRCVAIPPVYIDFAVSEERPLVFIKGVKLLPP